MRTNQKGFTLIELLIVVAIIGIIAAIAVPGLLRARMSGNEASAIGSMRAINTAQQNYSQQCNGYSPSLTELRIAGNFLSPDLTATDAVAKSGFNVTMVLGNRRHRHPDAARGLHRDDDELLRDRGTLEVRFDRHALVRDERAGHDLLHEPRDGADSAARSRRPDPDSVTVDGHRFLLHRHGLARAMPVFLFPPEAAPARTPRARIEDMKLLFAYLRDYWGLVALALVLAAVNQVFRCSIR